MSRTAASHRHPTIASQGAGKGWQMLMLFCTKWVLEESCVAEQNDRDKIFQHVQKQQCVCPILSAVLDCAGKAEYYL